MKTCRGCGESKPQADFSPHASSRDGLRPRCRPCENTKRRERRAELRALAARPLPEIPAASDGMYIDGRTASVLEAPLRRAIKSYRNDGVVIPHYFSRLVDDIAHHATVWRMSQNDANPRAMDNGNRTTKGIQT